MTTKVCIAGATGWVGKPLSVAISETNDLQLVGAVALENVGQSLQKIEGAASLDVVISKTVADALSVPTDVMVDFTRADVVKANVMTAIQRGVHVVIGSSGLTDDDFAEIHQAALEHKVGVIAAGNFSITAVLLERFACEAAKYLSHWEIIDYASDSKVDAPSGTVRELAFRLSEIRPPEVTVPIEKTVGVKQTRGATLNNSQVHSIRLPGYVIGVEVILGAPDERLTIRHDAGTGVTPYLQGTLMAIRKVKQVKGLVRGLDRIMD